MSVRRGRENSSDDEDTACKKERLDSTICKLGEKRGEKDTKSDAFEFFNTINEEKFRVISKTEILNLNYIMWENTSNECWLDAPMALLAHNHALRYEYDLSGSTHVKKIIKFYNEAMTLLNDDTTDWSIEQRLAIAKKFLSTVQDSALEYLQPILKNKKGDPDSAFCSMFNLIREDKTVKKFFEVKYTKSFLCSKCNRNRQSPFTKPIITLPRVVAFQPSSPSFISDCPSCKDPDQQIEILYKTLPKCLIFHFENGSGKGELCPLDFTICKREYKLTGLITLEKSDEMIIDHFVSWIKDPNSNLWLECNDLNPEVLKFTSLLPNCINMEDLYMIMFESFDDLGTIEVDIDKSVSAEKLSVEETEDDNIPFIDLSEDNEEHNNRTPWKKISGGKNNSEWNADCDLKFLNSICSSSKDLLTKADNDPQPDIFMKTLDLKPKTDENVSLEDTLSPTYTDLIKKLAGQNDDIEDQEKLPPSDLDQTLGSTMQNILSSKSTLKKGLSLVDKIPLTDKKSNVEGNIEFPPTVIKLVASENSQIEEENKNDPVIESEFLMEQHDKIDQILISRKSVQSKLISKSHDKNRVNDNDELNEKAIPEKDSIVDEASSDRRSPFPIEVNATINDSNAKTKLQDSMPTFPFEDVEQISVFIEQINNKDNKLNNTAIDTVASIPHENELHTPTKEERKPCGDSSPPLFEDFLNRNNSYDEMALSMKKFENVTPQNIIKVKRNVKPSISSKSIHSVVSSTSKDKKNKTETQGKDFVENVTPQNIIKVKRNVKPSISSKSIHSVVSSTSKDKKNKTETLGKDFVDLKMRTFSINVARLTPKEISQYSPGAILEKSSVASSPDSAATSKSSTSNGAYNEHFNDILKSGLNSNQKLQTNLPKKKCKTPGSPTESSSTAESSINKPSVLGVSLRKGRKKGTKNEASTKNNSNTGIDTNTASKNVTSSPLVIRVNENVSSPKKVMQEQTVEKGRKKALPKSLTTKMTKSMNVARSPDKAQVTLQSPKYLAEDCRKKESISTSEEINVSTNIKENEDIKFTTSVPSNVPKKRGRPKKEDSATKVNNQSNLKPFENTDAQVRKSTRKRADTFSNLNSTESSKKRFKRDNSAKQDKADTPVNVGGRKSETTPRIKDLVLEPSPNKLNKPANKSMQTSLLNKKNSAYIYMAVDCIVDFYLTKAYNLFSIGCEELDQ